VTHHVNKAKGKEVICYRPWAIGSKKTGKIRKIRDVSHYLNKDRLYEIAVGNSGRVGSPILNDEFLILNSMIKQINPTLRQSKQRPSKKNEKEILRSAGLTFSYTGREYLLILGLLDQGNMFQPPTSSLSICFNPSMRRSHSGWAFLDAD
jgi:hypothetical protein